MTKHNPDKVRSGQDEELRANPEVIDHPTPQHVMDAVEVIRDYLKHGWWKQAVIDVDGGVSFRLSRPGERIVRDGK